MPVTSSFNSESETARWSPRASHRGSLAADRVAAQEEERRRVSRELHDELGQRLGLLELQIAQMERELGGNSGVSSALELLRGSVGAIADDLHRICCRLHPAVLENLGLAAAVRCFCEEFTTWSNVRTRFMHCGVPSKLAPPIGLCLYRVVQEGLRNVAQHARATRAVVIMRIDEPGIEPAGIHVTIKDNGCGFPLGGTVGNGRLGLVSLNERVKLAGGTFAIDSAPNRGTRIRAWVPLSNENGDHPYGNG
jgi:signal transduction histidine kinase